jgi:hypothetical protein
VHAKNQAAIDAGRAEIETGRFVHGERPPSTTGTQSPVHQAPTPQYGPQYGCQQGYEQPTYGSQPATSAQGDARSGGRLNSFMKKMKEGPMASERAGGRNGGLKAVNE